MKVNFTTKETRVYVCVIAHARVRDVLLCSCPNERGDSLVNFHLK